MRDRSGCHGTGDRSVGEIEPLSDREISSPPHPLLNASLTVSLDPLFS
jgi:hypothetical protein